MTKTPLRVGIVGASAERGWAKDAHVPALARLPRFRITSVSAPTLPRAEAAAKAFGAIQAFGDSIALTKSPDVDVVVVTVRVPDHMPIVMAALEAGKHVFCEWPLGRTVGEAETMAAAAANAKGRTIIGLQGVAAPVIRRAAEIVRSGALGQIYAARVIAPSLGWGPALPPFYAYLNDRRNGATLVTIPGGHTLAMVERVLGPFVDVQAQTAIHHPKVRIIGTNDVVERTCADHLSVLGTHAGGCVTTVEIATSRRQGVEYLFEVSAASGELRITGRHGGALHTSELKLEAPDAAAPPRPVAPDLPSSSAYVAELYAMLAAGIDGLPTEAPDFAEALHIQRLLAAIETAAETGRRQHVPQAHR